MFIIKPNPLFSCLHTVRFEDSHNNGILMFLLSLNIVYSSIVDLILVTNASSESGLELTIQGEQKTDPAVNLMSTLNGA